jgi:ferredoxin
MAQEPFVDQDLCISCGICVGNVSTVFRFADNGKAECYDPGGESAEVIQSQAIDVCPVACICWKE